MKPAYDSIGVVVHSYGELLLKQHPDGNHSLLEESVLPDENIYDLAYWVCARQAGLIIKNNTLDIVGRTTQIVREGQLISTEMRAIFMAGTILARSNWSAAEDVAWMPYSQALERLNPRDAGFVATHMTDLNLDQQKSPGQQAPAAKNLRPA